LSSKSNFNLILTVLTFTLGACATMKPLLGIQNPSTPPDPIANPFSHYPSNGRDTSQSMILRTKTGDRSVEVEFPNNTEQLSELTLPLSSNYRDRLRRPASSNETDGPMPLDETYKNHPSSPSDYEITHNLPSHIPDLATRQMEIEKTLHLTPIENPLLDDSKTPSYLATVDRIKQLYNNSRFEAALLEIDDLLKQNQNDPTLYQMQGTLLDRLGHRTSALKSWQQSLKLNPSDHSLKKFIQQKETQAIMGSGSP
jgi:tetratricopeptide (TPR) repeat protein